MDQAWKYILGALGALWGFLAPIHALVLCAMVFVGIDFITGVTASYKVAKRNNADWGFESEKAYCTIYKLVLILAGIVLAWLLDSHILAFMNLRLANLFTGFVCGMEFWSYLENAALISNHPVFRWLKKYMKNKLDKHLDNNG